MEIDVAAKLWAETNDKVGEVHKKVMGTSDPKPIRKNLGVSNTPSALTSQVLIVPAAPASGKVWFIHKVVILGADGHTAAAGIADIYAGPADQFDAPSQIYSGLTLPTIIIEGRYHNPVLHGEQVYANVTGLTAQQVVQFAIGYDEFNVEEVLATKI